MLGDSARGGNFAHALAGFELAKGVGTLLFHRFARGAGLFRARGRGRRRFGRRLTGGGGQAGGHGPGGVFDGGERVQALIVVDIEGVFGKIAQDAQFDIKVAAQFVDDGFGAFGHLLAAGGEGEGAHEALEGTEAVGEIGRALGDALEQFGVSGVVGVGGDERFVLRTEFHGDGGDLLAEEDEELAEIFERDGGFLVEKLFEQPLHGGVAPLEVGKREEVAHEGEEIVAAHLLQLVGRGLLLGNVFGELEHGAVLDDGRGGNGGAEHQAFERLTTREGDVGLPVGESALHVDDGALEGEALALVHGDGPGGTEGILREGAVDHFFDLIGALVEDVAGVVPRFARHVDEYAAFVGADGDFIAVETHHLAEHAVEIVVVARHAVANEHDLRAAFEHEPIGRGVRRFGELVFDFGVVGESGGGERSHFGPVDGIGLVVVRDETHVGFAFGRTEMGHVARIELGEHGGVEAVAAHGVEEPQERVVRLSIDGLQFDGDEGRLAQGVAGKEVLGVVVARQQFAIFVLDYGRELLQIADEQQLHAAERTCGVAVATQGGVDTVEQVGAHHGDFVDDDEIETANEAALAIGHAKLVGAKLHARNEGGEGEL